MTRRRDFIAGAVGAATWPWAADAQQRARPVVGFLHSLSPDFMATRVTAFKQGLAQAGFADGRNIAIELRWAEGQYDRLPSMAQELTAWPVAVMLAGSTPGALAAKAATSTIPIVFAGVGGDPVSLGLVASFNRPGGNVTGIALLTITLSLKRLEILSEAIPSAKTIGLLVNLNNANAETTLREMPAAAAKLGRRLVIATVRSAGDLDAAFEQLSERKAQALLVDADPFLAAQRHNIVTRAERRGMPASFETRDGPAAGALMSYGPDFNEAYRLAGGYAGRILKGERPADLPVQQPTRFHMVMNLKAAKALGIEVPPMLLVRADEVIE